MVRSRKALSSYIDRLLSEGRSVFTAAQAEDELGITHRSFLDASERLQRSGKLIRPRQGFYVVVPPQYASWGAPPPTWFIDALMRWENEAYYVALLKAAELHGATHQAVMQFQVVCGVSTVLAELAPAIEPDELASLSARTERSVVQRLGYLLDWIGADRLAQPMLDALLLKSPLRWTELEREARDPDFASDLPLQDPKWRIVAHRPPEPDP